jgi:ferredoxin
MADRQLVVDRIRCDGRGHCAELLPELIQPDDWGYPIIDERPVPRHLMAHAKAAVDACPVLALALRRAAQNRRQDGRGD